MPMILIDKQQKSTAMHWLITLARPVYFWLILTILISIVSSLCLIGQLYYIAHIAQVIFLDKQSLHSVNHSFILLIILLGFRTILAAIKEPVSFQVSAKIKSNLREKILQHIASIGSINSKLLGSGELLNMAMDQVEALQEFFTAYLPQMIVACTMPLIILLIVFPINTVAGIILIVCAPLIPLFMILTGMGAASLQQKYFQILAKMSNNFIDTIQGLVTLKLLGKSKQQSSKIHQVADRYRIHTMKVLRVAFLSSAILEIFTAASIAILAVYLGMGFINTGLHSNLWWQLPNMNLQKALFVLLLAPEFFLPLRKLGVYYHAKAKAIAAAVELDKLFSISIPQNSTLETFWQTPSAVQMVFSNVSVAFHHESRLILDDINLFIEAGQKIAVAGPSGAGKTTLINALLGVAPLLQGEIIVNKTNIHHLEKNQWLQSVTWQGQHPHLFPGSIKDNLLLANPQAQKQDLYTALEIAQIAEEIKDFAQALDTKIGEQQAGLSSGQAQRIALARMLLKPAPLMLLDEPTANLHSEYAEKFFKQLMQHCYDKTIIVATHDLQYSSLFDRIIVMQLGKIVQQGDLSTLLADKTGLFYQLYTVGRITR